MKHFKLVTVGAFALLTGASAQACSDSDDAAVPGGSSDSGQSDASADKADAGKAPSDAGSNETPDASRPIVTGNDLLMYLEGKTFEMKGANIPSHPFGFDEDVNYGANTQCYQSVVLTFEGGNARMETVPGTLENAPNPNDKGTCDHATPKAPFTFTSTTMSLVEGAPEGACFDVDLKFPAFRVLGRARLAAAATQFEVELYYENQAEGFACANGAVGAAGVTVQNQPLGGDAVQKFVLKP